MTTHRVAELEGALLDAAVAKAEGLEYWFATPARAVCRIGCSPDHYEPSTDWALGGPIIERERIATAHNVVTGWGASHWRDPIKFAGHIMTSGETPLIAAMRAYVASKFGDTVELT